MEILTVKSLSFRYSLGKENAITDLSFSVNKGDFAVICGATGSGKSTLLRLLKKELIPNGELKGEIRFLGEPLFNIDEKNSACRIGYVMQNPEQQIVTDKVWHEACFGLENMGLPSEVIRRRVAKLPVISESRIGLRKAFQSFREGRSSFSALPPLW